MSQAVGFIGLGVMGRPMARNLLDADFDMVVHSRSQAPVRALASLGAFGATTPAEVAERSEIVITMLPDTPDVLEVFFGDAGLLQGAHSDLSVVDMSTIQPHAARKMARAAADAGFAALDAPVSGGESGAVDGSLSIMVGGDSSVYEACLPVFRVLGQRIVRVGDAGAGQVVKAANQLVVAGSIGLVSEALVLIEANGLDPQPALDVLAGGLAGSKVLDTKREALLRRDFTPGFRIELHHKDLAIAQEAARGAGVPLPVSAGVIQLVTSLVAQGKGGLDHSALLTVVEELAGRSNNEK